MNSLKCPAQLNKLRDYGPLLMEATVANCLTVNLVSETRPDDDQDYAAVILVEADGTERELFGKSPYAEAEVAFNEYLDKRQSKGDEAVITYCSFD